MALLLVIGASHAAEGWRVDGKLIRVGDSKPEVLRVAGKPDMRNRIESREGGTIGNRWYYVIDGYDSKTVIITFRGGRVSEIEMDR